MKKSSVIFSFEFTKVQRTDDHFLQQKTQHFLPISSDMAKPLLELCRVDPGDSSHTYHVGVSKLGKKYLKVTMEVFCNNKIIVPCIKVAQRHVWVRLLSILRKVPKIKMAQLFFKYTRFFGKFCSPKFLKQLSHFLTSNVQLIDNGKCFTLLQKLCFLWLFSRV